MGSSRQLRRIRHTSRSSRYRRRTGIDPASSGRLPRSGSRTSALKHVTGHRSAHVGVRATTSGVRATCFPHSSFISDRPSDRALEYVVTICGTAFGTDRSGSIIVAVWLHRLHPPGHPHYCRLDCLWFPFVSNRRTSQVPVLLWRGFAV